MPIDGPAISDMATTRRRPRPPRRRAPAPEAGGARRDGPALLPRATPDRGGRRTRHPRRDRQVPVSIEALADMRASITAEVSNHGATPTSREGRSHDRRSTASSRDLPELMTELAAASRPRLPRRHASPVRPHAAAASLERPGKVDPPMGVIARNRPPCARGFHGGRLIDRRSCSSSLAAAAVAPLSPAHSQRRLPAPFGPAPQRRHQPPASTRATIVTVDPVTGARPRSFIGQVPPPHGAPCYHETSVNKAPVQPGLPPATAPAMFMAERRRIPTQPADHSGSDTPTSTWARLDAGRTIRIVYTSRGIDGRHPTDHARSWTRTTTVRSRSP